jgi:small subunit ribosomal protein S6
MTLPAPTYDLVLLIDPKAEDGARAKIVSDTGSAVEAGGELLRHDEWGERPLSYPIDKKASAEYHLFQFHAGSPGLLNGLDRTLRITDGVLRFRIIKLAPGVPDAPEMPAASAPAAEHAPDSAATIPAPEVQTEAPAQAPADTPDAPAPEPQASEDEGGSESPDVPVAGPA